MFVELSTLQAQVLVTIRRFGPITPSHIGLRLDFEFEKASAHVTRPLKHLVTLGLVERVAVNKRVVSYQTTSTILPPFRIKKDEEGLKYQRLIHENQ